VADFVAGREGARRLHQADHVGRYKQVIDGHLIPHLGRIKLDKLSPRDVQRLVALLRDKLAPASVVNIHAVLRVALTDAQRLDLVARNVAKSVKLPTIGRSEHRALSPAEARKLLAEVGGDRLEAFFVLALTTGLRRGELLGLRRIDVETDEKVLLVRQTLQRVGGSLRIVAPKTHRSTRPVPLTQMACDALLLHLEVQEKEKVAVEELWRDSGLVFANTLGGPMEPRNVNRRFEQARKAAGLDWLRPHDLRHAFATFLSARRSGAADRDGPARPLDHPASRRHLRARLTVPRTGCSGRHRSNHEGGRHPRAARKVRSISSRLYRWLIWPPVKPF
jgi:integrase